MEMADSQTAEEGIQLFGSRPRKRTKHVLKKKNESPKFDSVQLDHDNGDIELNVEKQHAGHAKDWDPEVPAFADLGLSEWLEKVCNNLGIKDPTPVQKSCIPEILRGKDVIGVAQTGSGKTAAFALPILQKLSLNPYSVFCVVLTPTRELAFQIGDQFRALGTGQTLRVAVVVGGLDFQDQAKQLAKRPHVVIATPGRLKAILDADVQLGKGFCRTSFLVLDEADRLLDASFEPDLETILSVLPETRQTLLFSATMTSALITLQTALLEDAHVFEAYKGLQTATGLKEQFLLIPAKVKEVYLTYLLRHLDDYNVRSCIIFAGTRKSCEMLAGILEELDIATAPLHSGLVQRNRMASLDRFKSGRISILLATDVASRGLDIPEVDLVVNFDLPTLASDYVHRVGRTARAGRGGWSLSFVSQYDIDLVKSIEELTGQTMEKYDLDEKLVLKSLTEVYTAKRTAAMKASNRKRRAES